MEELRRASGGQAPKRAKITDGGSRGRSTQETVMAQQVDPASRILPRDDSIHGEGSPAVRADAVANGRALRGMIREGNTTGHMEIGTVTHEVTAQEVLTAHGHDSVPGIITATFEVHHPHLLHPGMPGFSKPARNVEARATIGA